MKKTALLIVLAFVLNFSGTKAQNVGLSTGANITNMYLDGESVGDPMMGYYGGLVIEHVLVAKKLYLQTNLEGVSRGFKMTGTDDKVILHNGQAILGPKYRQVLWRENNLFLGVYGYMGYAFLGKIGDADMTLGNGEKSPADMNGIDYGVMADAGLTFGLFNVGYRYVMGMADVSAPKVDGFKWTHGANLFFVSVYFSND